MKKAIVWLLAVALAVSLAGCIVPAQPVAVLKQSVQQSSMKIVKPVMLLTLWYVTGDNTYAAQLEKEYPQSPECAVVKGNASFMPVPFWYFVKTN